MRWWWVLLLVLAGCATPPAPVPSAPPAPLPVDPHAELRAVVEDFVRAADAGRFSDAHRLLSLALRERYSVERLAVDFKAEPRAGARLAKIQAHLAGAFSRSPGRAALEWAPGRSLRLEQEADGWRIAALE